MFLVKLKKQKIIMGLILLLLIISIFTLPSVSQAADRVPDGTTAADYQNLPSGLVTCDGTYYKCDIDAFIRMINNIINWIISIALTIFAISLIWGGYLYMTSGQNPGNKEKAKTIIWSTLKGFVIILVAWLIVYTILNTFVNQNLDENKRIFNFIGKE